MGMGFVVLTLVSGCNSFGTKATTADYRTGNWVLESSPQNFQAPPLRVQWGFTIQTAGSVLSGVDDTDFPPPETWRSCE